jgi:hypothetical protein
MDDVFGLDCNRPGMQRSTGLYTRTPHVSEVYGFALFGLDVPSALPCLAHFCTPDMVGGVVILPSTLSGVKSSSSSSSSILP